MKTYLLNDASRLFSCLTGKKVLNIFKLCASYGISRISGHVWHAGMPAAISVEPTTRCNLHCPGCLSGMQQFTRPEGNLSLTLFQHIVDQLYPHLWYLTLYFQGEPTLNTRLFDMIRLAKEKKIYVATSTNAHFLTGENARKTIESGLDRIIISLDGTNQETYEQYRRGGRFSAVTEGISNIMKWKLILKSLTPFVVVQFLVLRSNEHQLTEVSRLAKTLGADRLVLKTAQFSDYKHGNPLMPQNDKYSRYRKKPDHTYILKKKLKNHCFRMWYSGVITWDGTVVPCCFDKDAVHPMGNMNNHSFGEIWKNKSYQEFRQKLLKARKEIGICNNCTV